MALKSSCYLLLLFLLSGAQGDCPAPESPPHAELVGDIKESYPVGTTLRYKCIPGYQFIPGTIPTIKCLEDSTWSQTPAFCELKRCKAPDLPNGKIEGSDKLEIGDEITFVCNYGYNLVGSSTALCVLLADNRAEWDKSPPLCDIIQCERPPNIANGMHNGDVSLDHYTVSTVIKYTCNKDFSLIGDQSLTCIVAEDGANGKWDKSPPECKVVQCSRPEIENGKLTSIFQPSYNYNHTLQFTCNHGYKPEGSNSVTCGADSTWKPKFPTCVEETVTTRPSPTLTSHTEGDKKNETSGPTRQTTTKTTTKTTKDIISSGTTIQPNGDKKTESSGPTRKPSGTTNKPDPGNNSVAIVEGKLTIILVLLVLMV
ncbi:membrane cofactor protein-like [Anolis sagrei]|uniref:membrane cofactor protein-like n=1 Tax=Anolis sagrei TaxID=38937 RepID=UPI0035227A8C